MANPPSLLTDERIRAAYAEGAGIYRILPRAVARPASVAELAGLLRWSHSAATPLIPRGSGSGMPGGSVGRGAIVDLSAFQGVTVDREARLATAGAAATWAAVQEAARAFGLRLPPDPSSGAFATSGGMVSTNAAGPRTVRYGSVRRWVEAVTVVGGDGEPRGVRRGGGPGPWRPARDALERAARRFPATRKNSSGYALDAFLASGDELDLLIGAEGTLGFVTEVTWRLDPIPPDVAGVALGFADLSALAEAVPFLVALNPSAVELLDATLLSFVREAGAELPDGLACLLLVEFERETSAAARGSVGDAVRGLRNLTAHVETAVDRDGLARLWAVRKLASPALARLPRSRRSLQVIEDGCVPLARLGEYVLGVRRAAEARGIPVAVFGHAGDGHVHVNALPDTEAPGFVSALRGLLDDVTTLLLDLGGTPSGEHGDGRLRAGLLERFFGAEGMECFRDLKRAYDPRGMLNPGVILPAADWAPLADLKVGRDAAPIPDDIAARLRELEQTGGWATPKIDLAS
ncbi:MAG TPA: FAD-binding oxidoreductase [Gemmatimonadales bacterium]|nr:FAD-binding oxidoreductase [Gemmatimonadales bacterium]